MKATGIVRRIDDLGRVVIPKEIRRAMRVKEGDPLEIFTFDGGVTYKKYSPVGQLSPHVDDYAEALYHACGIPALICDRGRFVAVAGTYKNGLLNNRVSWQMEQIMEKREHFSCESKESDPVQLVNSSEAHASVVIPIIASGEVVGAVCAMYSNVNYPVSATTLAAVKMIADIIGRQVEE